VNGLIATIGLEIHVELETKTKMFCSCKNEAGGEANTHTCPVCLGLPGTLPRPNGEAVRRAVRLALALGMEIAPLLQFDRKNFFYPDLPKGYQITQKEAPIGVGGALSVGERSIRLHHLHLEEDAGKLLHLGGRAGVDFNRAGVPLVEIVSEPDLRSAEEARAYMEEMRRLIRHLGISEVRMEEGRMRADVNVSVATEPGVGTRSEIKNMNSFRAVERAIDYEISRQAAEIEAGRAVLQETRGFDDQTGETFVQRRKEEAEDYRYFPEPDILPTPLERAWIEEEKRSLPPTPAFWRRRMAEEGLKGEEMALLLDSPRRTGLYTEARAQGGDARKITNWILGDVLRLEGETSTPLEASRLSSTHLVDLVRALDAGTITGPAAKKVLERLYISGESVADVIEAEKLGAMSDGDALVEAVDQVLKANPKAAMDLRGGAEKAVTFLVGQLMRQTKGRADPKRSADLIRERAAIWKPPS